MAAILENFLLKVQQVFNSISLLDYCVCVIMPKRSGGEQGGKSPKKAKGGSSKGSKPAKPAKPPKPTKPSGKHPKPSKSARTPPPPPDPENTVTLPSSPRHWKRSLPHNHG